MVVVCDMSSDIATRVINWDNYGVVYAGGQKNLGPAGVTVVIIREDLIGHHHPDTSYLQEWELNLNSPGEYFNTPATYPIYVAGLNIAHMLKEGGLATYINLAEVRSKLMYETVDGSGGFYKNHVDTKYRSKINVVFRIQADADEEGKNLYRRLELKFLEETSALGLLGLKGHGVNKGIRASLYNAMPICGVEKLIQFMKTFQ